MDLFNSKNLEQQDTEAETTTKSVLSHQAAMSGRQSLLPLLRQSGETNFLT